MRNFAPSYVYFSAPRLVCLGCRLEVFTAVLLPNALLAAATGIVPRVAHRGPVAFGQIAQPIAIAWVRPSMAYATFAYRRRASEPVRSVEVFLCCGGQNLLRRHRLFPPLKARLRRSKVLFDFDGVLLF